MSLQVINVLSFVMTTTAFRSWYCYVSHCVMIFIPLRRASVECSLSCAAVGGTAADAVTLRYNDPHDSVTVRGVGAWSASWCRTPDK